MSKKRKTKKKSPKIQRKKTVSNKLPAAAVPVFQRAVQMHRSGQLREAETLYKQTLSLHTSHPDSLHLLGVIAAQSRDYSRAERLITKAIKNNPQRPDYFANLGNVYRDSNNPEKAVSCYEKAIQRNPDDFETLSSLGVIQNLLGQPDKAVNAFTKAIDSNPNHSGIHNNLGITFSKMDRHDEAIACFQKAIQVNPTSPEAYFNMGMAFDAQGNSDKAFECFQNTLNQEGASPDLMNKVGVALQKQGKFDKAIDVLQKALLLKPDSAETYGIIADAYKELGKFDEAVKYYKQVLRVKPDETRIFPVLVSCRKYETPDHEDITRIQKALKRPSLIDEDAMHLHFALGKAFDDCGDYETAFGHYQKGNSIKHRMLDFDARYFDENNEKILRFFTGDFFSNLNFSGSQSERPVFIVGMPRSGTTLAEQILSSHSKVHGAGELQKIPLLVAKLLKDSESYQECFERTDQEELRSLAEEYEEYLQHISGDEILRVTDKMLPNFVELGFIAIFFPRSHVIHCRRDPLDTCLSNYFQLFAKGNEQAYDLTDIGHYYRQYEQFMAHWRKLLPLQIYEIQYEELVASPEKKSRELINFLGLEWEENCLSFHKTRRSVKTASSWQVRQPIYTKSRHRWKNYEKFLGPLKESLGME